MLVLLSVIFAFPILFWLWRHVVVPILKYASVNHKFSAGIITLHLCEIDGNEEIIEGSRRELTDTQLLAYSKYLDYGKDFYAVKKYGNDTGIRVKSVKVTHFGPGSTPQYNFYAFDLNRPGKIWDTSYPFNESRSVDGLVRMILRREDRWIIEAE